MVHVGLDELQSLILDGLDSSRVHVAAQLFKLLAGQSLALFDGLLCGFLKDFIHIRAFLNIFPHAEAEVSEPLMVEGDGPVLTEEFDNVGNDASLVTLSHLVEVVLMQSNETPERLKHDLFVTHVGNRINQADAVEGELDEVTFACAAVKVVAHQVISVLLLLLHILLKDQWVCRLDVVVDNVARQDTTLALRQIEERQLIALLHIVGVTL